VIVFVFLTCVRVIADQWTYSGRQASEPVFGGLHSIPSVGQIVSSGGDQFLGLVGNGTIIAWGRANTKGVYDLPHDLEGVTQIAVGSKHAAAIRQDGTVITWGGGDTPALVPSDLGIVKAIDIEGSRTMAIKQDGTVVEWDLSGVWLTSVPAGLADVTQISAGRTLSLALQSDGSVVGWDSYGVLSTIPDGLPKIVSISTTDTMSLALSENGEVFAWGSNTDLIGKMPADLRGVMAISAGPRMGVALKTDGRVVAWGIDEHVIQSLNALTCVKEVVAGDRGSCAVLYDGSLKTYTVDSQTSAPPYRMTGQTDVSVAKNNATFLGYAGDVHETALRIKPKYYPLPAAALGARSLAGGRGNSIIVHADGTVSSYGTQFSSGEIVTPVGLANVKEVYSNFDNVVALQEDGQLVLWEGNRFIGRLPVNLGPVKDVALGGYNGYVLLEDGSTVQLAWGGDPAPSDLDDVKELACSWYFPLALKTDGTLVTWGRNAVLPAGIGAVKTIAGSGVSFYAVREDGKLIRWSALGSNPTVTVIENADDLMEINASSIGVIGRRLDGAVVVVEGSQATEQSYITDAVKVAAGYKHYMALEGDGTLHVWGDDFDPLIEKPSDETIVSLAMGAEHTIAINEDGDVVTWGRTRGGLKTQPLGMSDTKQVAAGNGFSVAVQRDGSISAWGAGELGQIEIPSDLGKVEQVAAGNAHVLVLLESGGIAAWGDNTFGQCDIPVDIPAIKQIVCGGDHNLALTYVGEVFAWGRNDFGQAEVPVSLSSVEAIAAGVDHSVVLKADGSVTGWGKNDQGQLNVPLWIGAVTGIASGPFADSTFYRFGPSGLSSYRDLQSDLEFAGLQGSDAKPGASPQNDGVSNLMKWASNLNLAGHDQRLLDQPDSVVGQPYFEIVESEGDVVFRVRFLRRKDTTLIYEAQFTNYLDHFWKMNGSETVDPIDATWERVTIDSVIDQKNGAYGFGRIKVILP